ncbi:MAG: UDP-N-acetylmuramoyl-L-alanyl-D-glutamate--2,6-diaminopimelate ligase [Buchnera aphidicola (Floraphis meitanensis)]
MIYIKNDIPIISFFKLSKYLFEISSRYYKINTNLTLIGITGTNGKSTVTNIISQWGHLLNYKIGIMSTLGNGIYNNLKPSKNTTESSINIQKFLHEMSINNIRTIAMEVSSHGIVQNRISKLRFSIAILTNVTSDHLDYHKTVKSYIQAKLNFFTQNKIKKFIINIDDCTGNNLVKMLNKKKVIAVSINKNFNCLSFKKWIHSYHIIHNTHINYIYFKSSWGQGVLKSKLIGHFNIINLLLALAALLELGYPFDRLVNTCKKITNVHGRMQIFKTPNKPFIVIDYAHNEDAFKNALQSIRKICRNKIWCVFGCGGDRDKSKRSLMGRMAENIADTIILTNDNPRNENPIEIIRDILKGCQHKKNIHIILNRKKAIQFSIIHANVDDYIVILGKGHEEYQIIKNKIYYFSDHVTIKQLLE